MSQILTGNLFKLLYSDDPANTLPIGSGVNEITNLSAMPALQINSNQLNYETYDSTYNTVLLSNKSISSFDITINYVPDELSTVFLDDKANSREAFQVILNYRQTDGTVDYAIVAGYITSTSLSGSKDSVVTKTYTFTPEEQVVSLRSINALEPLYQGNYGVGSNGTSISQYEPLTPEGNSFIKVPSSQAGNPAGADMLGVGLIDAGSVASLAMTKAGTLSLYAKNANTAWTRILTATQIASSYVPNTRTVNGKVLSSNITLSAADVGAMPASGGTISSLTLTTPLAVTSGGTGSNAPITGAYNIGAVPIRGQVASTGINFDAYGPTAAYIGQWFIVGQSQFNGSTNIPEPVTGILEVSAGGAFGCIQKYTTSAGTVYIRSLGAAWNATNPTWREWNQVGFVTAASAGNFTGNVDDLTSVGLRNISSVAVNLPIQQAGQMEITRFGVTSSQVLQTFKTLVTNSVVANRIYTRTYNGGTWSPWMELSHAGDSTSINYVRNPGFFSGGYLPTIGNTATATLEYVSSNDSRVPAGCSGGKVAIITKAQTTYLHNLNFGANNDDVSNGSFIPVAPGDQIDYSVLLNATGMTTTGNLRVVFVTYNNSTFVSNIRVNAYDPAVTGWQKLTGTWTVPANITNVIFGVWDETSAPDGSVAFISEPSVIKRLTQYAGSGTNTDIKQISGLTTPLAPNQGGTGSTGGALTLPTANFTGDANNVITAGVYSIPSTVLNLPLVVNGVLTVTTIASGTAIIQDFSSVALSSATVSRAWRRQGNVSSGVTTWKAWMPITQLPTEINSVDLNTFTNPGTYYGGSYTNGPSQMGNGSCIILVMANGAVSVVTQLAQYTSSNRTFTRTYAGGVWNDWVEVANTINTLSSTGTSLGTVDINTYGAPTMSGAYPQTSNANATAARNYPETRAGTLFVTPSAYGGCQQMYVTITGNMYIRSLTGTWTGTGPWAAWQKLQTDLNDIGIGGSVVPTSASFDWQQADLLASATYLVSSNNMTNTPAGVTVAAATGVYIRVLGAATNATRQSIEVIIDTAANAGYRIYEIVSVGAKGSRVFTVRQLYTTANVTVDANGFLKAASPIVKLFNDGRSELNNESEGATTTRISTGVYKIEGVLGLNSDAAWGGIDGGFEIPLDRNKQPRLWLDYDVEEDGTVIVKTYHRIHPNAPAFARNEIEGYSDGDPIDIPFDNFISVRVEMPERVVEEPEPIPEDEPVEYPIDDEVPEVEPEPIPEDEPVQEEVEEPLPEYIHEPEVYEPVVPEYYEDNIPTEDNK